MTITPKQVDLEPGQAVQFTAELMNKGGNSVDAKVHWDATGGTIDDEGRYVAGSSAGEYWVAAARANAAARASVRITTETAASSNPDLVPTTIEISPREVEMSFGETRRFYAAVRDQDGNRVSASVSWKATGGVVTTNGSYTAGSQLGTYQVTATSGRLSASAPVTITSDPPPSGSIEIFPGESIQAAVDQNPEGATFLIKAGVHRRQGVRPKDGMTFVGEPGAVLDGEGEVRFAFVGHRTSSSPASDNVTIRNLEIRNYDSPLQFGAIKAADNDIATSATGWVIEDCDIHRNSGGAIRTGHRMVIRGNYIHHNGQIGIAGQGDNILVEDNEIAFNNTRNLRITGGTTGEYGGTKFVATRNLIVRNNYVHDNTEHGLWIDINNVDTLIEGNRVVDNTGAGIFFEISYGAVIRNNYLEGNASVRGDYIWHYSGIFVSSSHDVEIYGNTLVDNRNGITAWSSSRGSGPLGVHEVRNLYVHDNTITMSDGLTGLGQDIGDSSFFTSKNNRFENNTYTLGSNPRYFAWMNREVTEDQWQDYGQDTAGDFNR